MRATLVAAGLLALLGAALLVGAPRGQVERIVSLLATDADAPFDTQVVVDTDRGELHREGVTLASFARSRGVTMTLRGTSGAGVVLIEVRDPTGTVVIRDLLGPDETFDLAAPVPPDVDIEVAATPAVVAAPGGEVRVSLTVIPRDAHADPLLLVAAETWTPWLTGEFGPEHERPGTIEPLRTLGASDPQGCGRVLDSLPVALHLDVPVTCAFDVEVVGNAGEVVVGEVALDVAHGDVEARLPDVEVAIPIVEPGAQHDPGASHADDEPDRLVGVPQPPVHATLDADAGGAYKIHIIAEQPSPGFALALEWFEPGPPVGNVLAGLWVAAGALALTAGVMTPRRATVESAPGARTRLAGAGLALAGLALLGALWATADRDGFFIVGGAHAWYWTRGFVALSVATLALVTVGTLLASPGAARRGRILAWPLLVGGAVVAAAAVAAGLAGHQYGTETHPASFYAGDYLLLAYHLQALVSAGVLLAIGGLLYGTRSRPR